MTCTHPRSSVPAKSRSDHQSAKQLAQFQKLSIKHATPAVLCVSSDTGQGTSAVVDSAGRILFQQSGGQAWTLSLALWFKKGQDRSWTGYENHGGPIILGSAVLIWFAILAIEQVIEIRNRKSKLSASAADKPIQAASEHMHVSPHPRDPEAGDANDEAAAWRV
jgi:hypothetical protein